METPNSIVSVGIVEDQRRTREGLCALIDGSEGFHCVGAWRSMEEALSARVTSNQPQVILLDLGLPGMSGIDGIPRLREKWPAAARPCPPESPARWWTCSVATARLTGSTAT